MNLIDELLAQQQVERPVEALAARQSLNGGTGTLASFRQLIPLSRPGPGEQYAFEVDMDRCTGCKACVAACHSLNGLDEEETWREVGLLIGGTASHPRTQTVTSACHHCIEPGCLEGCPVLAYEKDPVTGIVRHLDDQCIGCSYCILKCPYEVPKYSRQLGIVRKCDMCQGRLAVGEAPACVQACPTEAISIRLITRESAVSAARNEIFLPDAPAPGITIPTTVYKTAKPLSERARSANHHRPVVQHTHWPLVFMLALTQAGVGAMVGALSPSALPAASVWAAVLFFGGLLASVLHLGQPLKAWRAFLGWRTSWLSREILVFGASAPAFAGAAGFSILLDGNLIPAAVRPFLLAALQPAIWTTGALGILGVACSAAVYHDTHRAVWRGPLSFVRFFATGALFALAFGGWPQWAAVGVGAKLLAECLLAMRGAGAGSRSWDDLDRAGRLLRGALRGWLLARIALGALAIAALLHGHPAIGILFLLAGEILERALFFKAGVSTRMPGL